MSLVYPEFLLSEYWEKLEFCLSKSTDSLELCLSLNMTVGNDSRQKKELMFFSQDLLKTGGD